MGDVGNDRLVGIGLHLGSDTPEVITDFTEFPYARVMMIGADEAGVNMQGIPKFIAASHPEVSHQEINDFLFCIEGNGHPVGCPVGNGG